MRRIAEINAAQISNKDEDEDEEQSSLELPDEDEEGEDDFEGKRRVVNLDSLGDGMIDSI